MSSPSITVYWRPGCGFCATLLRFLDQYEVPATRINIWDDPDGSAYVRSVARGNETVPTVRVGSRTLVNPTGHQVMAALADEVPDEVPAGYEAPQPGRVGRWLTRVLGG